MCRCCGSGVKAVLRAGGCAQGIYTPAPHGLCFSVVLEVDGGAGKYLLPNWEWYFQKLWKSIDAIRYSKVLSLPLAKFT